MTSKVFVLDTNVISDIANPKPNEHVLKHFEQNQVHVLCLCQPVDYEVRRGYLKSNAVQRLAVYEAHIIRQFRWVELQTRDWQLAAQLWADARNAGKQLADTDLLIAAIALRLNAAIVSSDDDFESLPVIRDNWREPITEDND